MKTTIETDWYENGQKKSEGSYKKGKWNGLQICWYANGQKKSEGSYRKGCCEGVLTSWYENGQKRSEGSYKNGECRGLRTEWYENGQKKSEHRYKKGIKRGLWVSWYENGLRKSENRYKKGRKGGLWVSWYENGQKKSEQSYKKGKREGLWISWYENGQKELEKYYVDHKLDGFLTFWYKNGQKKSEQSYKEGRKKGPYSEWDEDINFVKTEIFKGEHVDDKVVSELKLITDYDGNFDYWDIRNIAIPEVDVWHELDRGRAILETLDQLNQYWHSYSPMIKRQWDNIFDSFDSFVGESYEFVESDLEIIDYGCGQGGASILFLDEFYKDWKTHIAKIKLIETSSLALQRATEILECYSSDIQIVAINKELDHITSKELKTDNNRTTIHLFSNILDIEDFDIIKLFNEILINQGNHFFMAVSHDRDFSGGSRRVHDVYETLIDPTGVKKWEVVADEINTFECSKGKFAIKFLINVEVASGFV